MARRTFWVTVLPAVMALFSNSASATLSSGEFMSLLRQAASDASSAVPPLRMRERVAPRVLTGKFDGEGIDSIVITESGTAFCKGAKPEPRTCTPINGLTSSGKTVAVNDEKGKTVLLQFDGTTMAQVCSINAKGFRASLDCRALDARKFPEHKAQLTQDGKGLLVEGTDGKYLCTEAGGSPTCLHFLDRDGKVPEQHRRTKKHHELQLAPKAELHEWRMVAASLYMLDEYGANTKLEIWQGYMDAEIWRDCFGGGCGFDDWWSSRWGMLELDPRRDRCIQLCNEQRDVMLSMCAGAAGVACIGGAVVAGPAGCLSAGGAVGMACVGGGGIGDLVCRSRC